MPLIQSAALQCSLVIFRGDQGTPLDRLLSDTNGSAANAILSLYFSFAKHDAILRGANSVSSKR